MKPPSPQVAAPQESVQSSDAVVSGASVSDQQVPAFWAGKSSTGGASEQHPSLAGERNIKMGTANTDPNMGMMQQQQLDELAKIKETCEHRRLICANCGDSPQDPAPSIPPMTAEQAEKVLATYKADIEHMRTTNSFEGMARVAEALLAFTNALAKRAGERLNEADAHSRSLREQLDAEWEKNIHAQLDRLGVDRADSNGNVFSINGRFSLALSLTERIAELERENKRLQEAIERI